MVQIRDYYYDLRESGLSINDAALEVKKYWPGKRLEKWDALVKSMERDCVAYGYIEGDRKSVCTEMFNERLNRKWRPFIRVGKDLLELGDEIVTVYSSWIAGAGDLAEGLGRNDGIPFCALNVYKPDIHSFSVNLGNLCNQWPELNVICRLDENHPVSEILAFVPSNRLASQIPA